MPPKLTSIPEQRNDLTKWRVVTIMLPNLPPHSGLQCPACHLVISGRAREERARAHVCNQVLRARGAG